MHRGRSYDVSMQLTDAQKAKLPNQLTVSRVVLAALFFLVLSFYEPGGAVWPLVIGVVLFTVAALTDAADGHLARKWQVVSKFGRIVDPFADKILVLGALVYLAGPNFVKHGESLTGVWPWMVVVILGRELLVTTIRAAYESEGVDFSANWWGKWKMILQSVVVPVVLILVMCDPLRHDAVRWVRDGLVWATVLVSAMSGVPYVTKAIRVSK